MITPTDDSSRLSAMPLTPLENATISPVMTPERPWIRAMPSPTSSTRPTSVRVTWAWNCSISRWMTEVISSALNFMRLSFDQSLAKLFESVADRGVVDVVADLDDQPPDQGRVDDEPDDGRGAEHLREPLGERGLLGIVERDGRLDDDLPAVPAPVRELARRADDRGKGCEPAVTVQDPEEADNRGQSAV